MTVIGSDAFTGIANNANLTTHTSDSGHSWTRNGFSTGNWVGDGSGQIKESSGEAIYTLGVAPTNQDYEASLDIVATTKGTDGYVGILLRCNPTTTPWYLAFLDTNSNTVKISKQGTGNLASAAFTVVASTTYTLRVTISGTSSTIITVYINAVQVLTYTDNTSPHTTANRAGIAGAAGTGTLWQLDNFSVSEAGAATVTLSGGGTVPVPGGSGSGLTYRSSSALSGSGTVSAPSGSGVGLAVTNPTYALSGSATIAAPAGSGTGLTFANAIYSLSGEAIVAAPSGGGAGLATTRPTYSLSGGGTVAAPGGSGAGLSFTFSSETYLSAPSFAQQDNSYHAALGPDGYSWAQAAPIVVDRYGKIVSTIQRTSGNGQYWIWSNNGGTNWTNSLDADNIPSLTRVSVAYDDVHDLFHALLLPAGEGSLLYRRYTPTRDGSQNITAITQVSGVSLTLASGGTYAQPVILWLNDAVYGAHGALVASYAVYGASTGVIRATMRVLSNTTADATGGNWEAVNGSAASALSGETISAPATNVASKATTIVPGVALARWRGVTRAGDLTAFYAYFNGSAYTRRLPYNSGTGRWGTLTTEQVVTALVGSGGSAQQEEQLLSKPAEDEANGRMWIGLDRWKDGTNGETWSVRYIDSADTLGALIDVYSAGGVFQPADYALTGDIIYDNQGGRLISAHVKSGAGTNDAVFTVWNGTTLTQTLTAFTAADVDIPVLYQDQRTGDCRYGNTLLCVFRDTDGYPATAPPYRGWFGTVSVQAVAYTLSAAGTIGTPTGSGAGLAVTAPPYTLSGGATIPTVSGSGAGLTITAPTYALSGSGTVAVPSGSGAGLQFANAIYSLSGTGTVPTVAGNGAGLTFSKPVYALSGAGSVPVPSGGGVGLVVTNPAYTLSGSATVPGLTGSGAGLRYSLTGFPTISNPRATWGGGKRGMWGGSGRRGMWGQ